jgi:hypothetical protein
MIAASGIELLMASRTGISALHVLLNAQFRPAGPAKNRFLTPFILRPDFDGMIGQRSMAILACVINSATLHLDRNDVSRPVPMFATGLRIQMNPAHFWKIRSHFMASFNQWSGALRRTRRSAGPGPQSESQVSSAEAGRKGQARASGWDSRDARKK